ncbi:MAG: M20/M25/M40 family metallo-hydrolase, partial [Planctomycetota bacterium]
MDSPPPHPSRAAPRSGHPPARPDGLAWLSLALLLAAAAAGLVPPTPRPFPASAPAGEFAAERALVHLREIARAPHPTGSPENAAVRAYLQRELAAAGLAVETQTAPLPFAPETPLVNVLARLPGRDPTGAIALVAHHDSRPARNGDEPPVSCGAGDDGAAVAAILETLRALGTGPPLKNDLLVVITDAEERGLCGARAFLEHPWCAEIDAVLNFEGRGSRGPVLMFETSEPSGWLVAEWAEAAPHPVGASMMAAVYRRMPNDSDFTVFRERGVPGLNFAFIGGYEAYHTALDTVENLDPASVQHHGETMLALARRLGELDLGAPRPAGELVYFDAVGSRLVRHSPAWRWPELALASLLALFATAAALRRGEASLGRLLGGGVAMLAAIAAATALAAGLVAAVLAIVPGARSHTPHDEIFFAALALAAAALVFGLARLADRLVGPRAVDLGWLAGWILLLVATC